MATERQDRRRHCLGHREPGLRRSRSQAHDAALASCMRPARHSYQGVSKDRTRLSRLGLPSRSGVPCLHPRLVSRGPLGGAEQGNAPRPGVSGGSSGGKIILMGWRLASSGMRPSPLKTGTQNAVPVSRCTFRGYLPRGNCRRFRVPAPPSLGLVRRVAIASGPVTRFLTVRSVLRGSLSEVSMRQRARSRRVPRLEGFVHERSPRTGGHLRGTPVSVRRRNSASRASPAGSAIRLSCLPSSPPPRLRPWQSPGSRGT
jgi:hypothetical protein